MGTKRLCRHSSGLTHGSRREVAAAGGASSSRRVGRMGAVLPALAVGSAAGRVVTRVWRVHVRWIEGAERRIGTRRLLLLLLLLLLLWWEAAGWSVRRVLHGRRSHSRVLDRSLSLWKCIALSLSLSESLYGAPRGYRPVRLRARGWDRDDLGTTLGRHFGRCAERWCPTIGSYPDVYSNGASLQCATRNSSVLADKCAEG